MNSMKTKNNIAKELVDIFIEAKNLTTGDNGICAIHILQAFENKDKKIKNTLKYSILLQENYNSEKKRLIKKTKIKDDKVSPLIQRLVVAHGNNYEDFFFALIKTEVISSILSDSYAEYDSIYENYKKDNLGSEGLQSSSVYEFGDSEDMSKNDLFTDLTEKARKGELSKVVGREQELLNMFQILQRQTKSNPIIIGESGVGKTTVVEALAQRIVNDQVPNNLKGKKILEFDISSIFSGAKHQGDLEKRIKKMLNEINAMNGEAIVFIDNIHNIHSSRENKMNLADMFKPALSRSELIIIGTTTTEKYKSFEEDISFARHFQTVKVAQPSIPETISILRGLKKNFEKHYNIEIDDTAIIQAVKLSGRYITERNFPDKAIDIIDEAASIVRISLDSKPIEIQKLENKIKQKELEKKSITLDDSEEAEFELSNLNRDLVLLKDDLSIILQKEKKDLKVIAKIKEFEEEIKRMEKEASVLHSLEDRLTFEKEHISILKMELGMLKNIQLEVVVKKLSTIDVLRVIAMKTGVPVDKMAESDRDKIMNLERNLSDNLIGQNTAVNSVSRAIKRSMAGLSDLERPNGSFLFLGSSGVGKTELCKQLSYEMFGSKDTIIRLDMSEYQDKGTVSKLIGSPSGYQDSDKGGLLTDAVRKRPYSIVLFDEIEKADPEVLNLLLQVLDEGHLTDGRGRKINFKNTIIVLTSNIGSEHINKNSSGEHKKVMKELEKKMRPELINRIDEVVIFDALDKISLRKIAKLMVKPTIEKLEEKRIKIKITDECLDLVVQHGYEPRYGARPLKRKIQTMIDDLLSDFILAGYLEKGSEIELIVFGGKIKLITSNENKQTI